jgi:predicted transcriptional regulator
LKVLLSIKPEFVAKILDGSKRYEYRRTIFKRREVKVVVVYESNPIRKVVGEFDIGEIIRDHPVSLWAKTKYFSGTTAEKFFAYFDDKSIGYAIEIALVRRYDMPKSLQSYGITLPPQSFRYIDEQ